MYCRQWLQEYTLLIARTIITAWWILLISANCVLTSFSHLLRHSGDKLFFKKLSNILLFSHWVTISFAIFIKCPIYPCRTPFSLFLCAWILVLQAFAYLSRVMVWYLKRKTARSLKLSVYKLYFWQSYCLFSFLSQASKILSINLHLINIWKPRRCFS